MHPETQDLLYLIAEIAMATVALSGITMVLAISNLTLSHGKAGQIAAQLLMSFAVVVFAIFPLLLNRFELEEGMFWRVASAGYLAIIVTLNSLRIYRAGIIPKMSGAIGGLVTATASTRVILKRIT